MPVLQRPNGCTVRERARHARGGSAKVSSRRSGAPGAMGRARAARQEVEVSADCLDMLTRLLVAEPGARMNMEQIKVHRWFQRGLPPGALEMNDFLLQGLADMDEVVQPAPARPACPAPPPACLPCLRPPAVPGARGLAACVVCLVADGRMCASPPSGEHGAGDLGMRPSRA